MHTVSVVTAALAAAGAASALPSPPKVSVNPWAGKQLFVNPTYATKLEQTITSFLAQNDTLNAARVKSVQKVPTFVWVSDVKGLANIPAAIQEARKQRQGFPRPLIGLVHYDLPDRDCSAGESAGEFSSAKDGLNLYKTQFVDKFAAELAKAPEIDFAVILEPDSLGNAVTNQNIEFCKNATPIYEAGIAYAIQKLQAPNIHLYIDAAHGGWLGWPDNLVLAAAEFSKVKQLAGNSTKIRGFATNVSNFNPYIANPRANYTEYSPSYDEFHYAESLSVELEKVGLPSNFIIDQGRAGLQNSRPSWSEWCNVKAGYGLRPTAVTNSTHVDAIAWVKPGGESDGACGPAAGAPGAGQWFNSYVEDLVRFANPPFAPSK